MPTSHRRARSHLERLLRLQTPRELRRRLEPKFGAPSPKVPNGAALTRDTLEQRWRTLPDRPGIREALADPYTLSQIKQYGQHIENCIGSVKIPVGLAGPLRVNGLFAQGDYYIPLATTEATLVASYNRGAQLITEAGGCSAALLNEGVSRAPGFAFKDLREVGCFVSWAIAHVDEFRREAEATTRHGQLIDMGLAVEGNHVYLTFEFTTADASGQNMVTIATEAICAYIQANAPIRPHYFFIEANLSGDKKATYQSFLTVRGKKVTAEVLLPRRLVEESLHTTPERMADCWRIAAIGGALSGTIGLQGHYANGLTALYIACGQDPACVAESAVGVTRFEVTGQGELYASVTLPSVMVGTVGGGTCLPGQRACLELMGLAGAGKAQALAEVCAGLCLAGELSIVGALCEGAFARAHQCYARGNGARRVPEGAVHE
jgi:hydroxymethylglutaryl-CoA reductase (NADPH)